jgi:hypothetical protein
MFTSNKTVQNFITELNAQKPSGEKYSDSIKVNWINEVEQNLYSKIIEEYIKDSSEYTNAGQNEFPLDITGDLGIQFEDIRKVYVNNVEYSKVSIAYTPEGSYFKNDGKLDINPRPSGGTTVNVSIVYRERPSIKTTSNIATDKINLPDQHIKIVTYYCFSQIHLLDKEYAEAQNWLQMYNDAVADFVTWYGERKAQFGN